MVDTKIIFGGNLGLPKSKKLKNSLFSWIELHKNVKNAVFKQTYILKLFIALKIAYFYCFSLGGNLEFDNIDHRKR